jgi:hypothetical protein
MKEHIVLGLHLLQVLPAQAVQWESILLV